ncbi:MAG: hypothetical protein ACJ75F_08320 [Flavisolibacter sp.]
MRTRYDILISVHVEHKYFTDKFFDAFELVPDSQTSNTIQRLGLLTKKVRNDWFLFYQSIGPWQTNMNALVNKEFTFILNIKDDAFDQYTNPELIPKPEAIQFYAATVDSQFFSSSRFVESVVFDYQIQHTDRPVNIKLKKLKGDVLKDVAILEPTTKTFQFDVSPTGEQAYDISEDTLPATEEKKREILVYENYFNDRFYGMVYFKVLPVTNENSNQYALVFDKK